MCLILGYEIFSTLIKKYPPTPSGILSGCHLQCQHRLGDGKGWELGSSGAGAAIVPQQDGLSLCFAQSLSLPSSSSPVLEGAPQPNGNSNSCGMICKELPGPELLTPPWHAQWVKHSLLMEYFWLGITGKIYHLNISVLHQNPIHKCDSPSGYVMLEK